MYQDPRWRKLRDKVLFDADYRCYLCGDLCDQVDHVVAVDHGGALFDENNLAAVCGLCNKNKVADDNRGYSLRVDTLSGQFLDPRHPSNKAPMEKIRVL